MSSNLNSLQGGPKPLIRTESQLDLSRDANRSTQNPNPKLQNVVGNVLRSDTFAVPSSDDDSLRGGVELLALAGGQQSGQNETHQKKRQKVHTTAKSALVGNTSNSGTSSAQTASNTLALSTASEPKTTKRNRNDPSVEDSSPSTTTVNSTLEWTGKRLRSGNAGVLTTPPSSILTTVSEQSKKIPDLEDSIAALVTSSTSSEASLSLVEALEDTKKSLVALLEGIRDQKGQLSSNQTTKK